MIATSGSIAVGVDGAGRLQAVLAADRRELLALLPRLHRLRANDVHRSRVLDRRIRALLRTYAPAFDRDRARHARRRLKALARALEDCREADVRERLFRDVAASGEGPTNPVPAELTACVAAARARARRKAARRLLRPDFAADLRAALTALEIVDRPDIEWMLTRLARRGRAVARRTRRARGANGSHRLRLAVKGLRYALAPLEDVSPGAGHELHARLHDAQQQLGDQHDAALALAWLDAVLPADVPGRRDLRRILQKREEAARRAARGAARRIAPAWRRWRTATADEVKEAPWARRGRA